MLQMKREKTISYQWWRDSGEDIDPSHVEALAESAENRIAEMMKKGYPSGVLCDNICSGTDDEDGVEYSGWWEVKTKKD
ncbi:MAG: hypothetical protein BWY66_00395 [bacterium ADurb.Bin374]|nr:MAG: hypothetical protein BWY66_00395 [bacterium ADurb.Bin374]